uniref:Secreted protein n=1 Tax=Steinernema glaseri TaxID=37863 RepID=A0A1I7Z673_9BILA
MISICIPDCCLEDDSARLIDIVVIVDAIPRICGLFVVPSVPFAVPLCGVHRRKYYMICFIHTIIQNAKVMAAIEQIRNVWQVTPVF